MPRGTTFVGDEGKEEFWPCSVAHDIRYEVDKKTGLPLFGVAFNREYVRACQAIFEELRQSGDKVAVDRFARGYQCFRFSDDGATNPMLRYQADEEFDKHMRRVIKVTPGRRRKWQLDMSRRQRVWFINMPDPLKNAFLWVNRLFGGA